MAIALLTHVRPSIVMVLLCCRYLLLLAVAVAGTVVSGCYPDLSECDDARARRPAYDANGAPLYEGQALVHVSCGAGSLCHAEAATPAARIGAPYSLNFSIDLTTYGFGAAEEETARLARNQRGVFEHRYDILGAVHSGTMPPEGNWSQGEYYRDDDTPLPAIDSDEAYDTLENWLACGAPVVERTTYPPAGVTTVGDIVAVREARTPDPMFASLFDRVFYPRCGISCHGPNVPSQLTLSALDLSTPELAYAALLRTAGAEGVLCGGHGPLVVAGEPTASLLIAKLEGTQECGDPMPTGSRIGSEELGAIRAWIEMGARDD